MPETAAVIRVEDVHREYRLGRQRVFALAGVSLAVKAGEFVAIMGASGSGKSTLLNVLGGLDHPTRGRIRVGEAEVTALGEQALCRYRRQQVGFVFQKFNLLSSLTALENVEFPLIFGGVPVRERRARAERALNAVGLGERRAHRPPELSGGEQQRVAIARALVANPTLLLADEPTGNLDSQTSGEIMALLADLSRQGRTLLMVTHDERLATYAHRLVRLSDGRIQSDVSTHSAERA